MALNPCPLRHHTERRARRTDGRMQLDRSFDNALPRFGLLLGAAFEGVSSGHFLIAHICAFIVDGRKLFHYTHSYHEILSKSIALNQLKRRRKDQWKRKSAKSPTASTGFRHSCRTSRRLQVS